MACAQERRHRRRVRGRQLQRDRLGTALHDSLPRYSQVRVRGRYDDAHQF